MRAGSPVPAFGRRRALFYSATVMAYCSVRRTLGPAHFTASAASSPPAALFSIQRWAAGRVCSRITYFSAAYEDALVAPRSLPRQLWTRTNAQSISQGDGERFCSSQFVEGSRWPCSSPLASSVWRERRSRAMRHFSFLNNHLVVRRQPRWSVAQNLPPAARRFRLATKH